ncbi:MAG: hypothetical protein CMH57_14470 [Myxococcales bacterium]|nr:hypothetical protein [Myxococcales bacterium]
MNTARPRLAAPLQATLTLLIITLTTAAAAEDTEDRRHNHDSLVAGATVHSFAGDAGSIDPFFGFGLKWDTFSDFQDVEGLKDRTIWEFISLGMTVFYFQSVTPYEASLDYGDTTLEFDGEAFQVGILATLMYLPGALHPYIGIGFAWTEMSASDDGDDAPPGREIFPMFDANIGSRLDLSDTFFLDLSLYANWGRDSNILLDDTRNILFFSTFLGVGVNVL